MKNKKNSRASNKSGVSYTISAVIITATTVMLVLIASTFAYQLLEQQRGTSEYNLTNNSLLTLDDAIQDIAWSIKGARQTRFSIDYGQLALYPDNAELGLNLTINITVNGDSFSWSNLTGYVEYSIPENSVTFARREPYYLLGDEEFLLNDGTSTLGRILIYPASGWVNSKLSYRVRVMETSTITVGGEQISYVNVWIIKLKISDFSAKIDNFDVSSRAYSLLTETKGPYDLNPSDKSFMISAEFEDELYPGIEIQLDDESTKVVFNFIISEVELVP